MNVCALFSAVLVAVFGISPSITASTVPPSTATPTPPSNTPPVGNAPDRLQGGVTGGGGEGGVTGAPPQQPPLPVWAQCLSQVQTDAPKDSSLPSLFNHWCSNNNYEKVIPCLESGLVTNAALNPLDSFVKLHFDAAMLRQRSADLCKNFQGVSNDLQCVQQNNATLEEFCRVRFSRGLQYVFGVQLQRVFQPDTYRKFACQVTTDTTGCLGTAMSTCSSDVKRHVLAYYALFTNESCVADPDAEYTTPAPPPTRSPPHDTVIMCAQKVAEALPTSDPLPQDASQLDQLIHGLRHNCRTFEARYNCYDEELRSVQSPSFRDLWLILTFDKDNAVKAQKEFCDGFEGGVIGSLNAQCYNETQPRLQECEVSYSHDVGRLEQQWVSRRIVRAGLHQAACAASLTRAFCLQRAFQLCGAPLAQVMLNSELGTLPGICLTLLQEGSDDNTTASSTTAATSTVSTRTDDRKAPVPTENSNKGGPNSDDGDMWSKDVRESGGPADQKSSRTSVSADDATGSSSKGGNGATHSALSSLALVLLSVVFSYRVIVL